MMRAAFITMLLMTGGLRAPGQSGFLAHFGLEQGGLSGYGHSVRAVDDGYLVFGHQVSADPLGLTHCVVFKVDLEGQFMWRKELQLGDPSNYNFGIFDPIDTVANGFACVVDRFIPVSQWLYLMDAEGDTISTHHLELPPVVSPFGGYYGTRATRVTTDGNFLTVGHRTEIGSGDSIPPVTWGLIVLMEPNGDTIWSRTYGPHQMVLYSGAQIPGGGYYLGGTQSSGSPWDRCLLICADSSGNELWRRHFGGRPSDRAVVKALPNAHALTYCTYAEPGWPSPFYQLMLTEWDADGEVVWQKKSHYGNSTGFGDLEVLEDGSIITAGQWWGLAQLAKFSSTGDSLWSRHYEVTNSYHESYDVQPTSDGGFIATGFARTSELQGDSISGLEVIWVLKTDSLGCVVPGCQNVGVEEYAMDLQEHLRVSPNPASEVVSVELELPEGFRVEGQIQAYLQDAAGRLVVQQAVGQQFNSLRAAVDVRALSSGIYYLHLRDARRWLSGTKLVVE